MLQHRLFLSRRTQQLPKRIKRKRQHRSSEALSPQMPWSNKLGEWSLLRKRKWTIIPWRRVGVRLVLVRLLRSAMKTALWCRWSSVAWKNRWSKNLHPWNSRTITILSAPLAKPPGSIWTRSRTTGPSAPLSHPHASPMTQRTLPTVSNRQWRNRCPWCIIGHWLSIPLVISWNESVLLGNVTHLSCSASKMQAGQQVVILGK